MLYNFRSQAVMSSLWGVVLTVLLVLNKIQRFQTETRAIRDQVTCRRDGMLLLIPKQSIQSEEYLYVRDRFGNLHNAKDLAEQCLYELSETPDLIIFTVSYSSCHVQREVHGGNITLWVDIVAANGPNSTQGSAPIRLTASCTFTLFNTSSSESVAATDAKSMSALKEEGVLRAQMRFATDSSFRSFYKSREHPAKHVVGEPVFVEIFVLKHEDQDLVLLLDDCWATPSADPQDKHRWNLLHKGCPQQGPDYSVELLEVLPGERVKYPKLHKRLKIIMFSFLETEDGHESVHLHCDVEVCKGAQCQRKCNKKRRRSSVQWILRERPILLSLKGGGRVANIIYHHIRHHIN